MTEAFVNGKPADSLSVSDRGLAFADGLFETMRVVNGEIPLWHWHWQRLVLGLERLKLPSLDRQIVENEISKFIEFYRLSKGSVVIKLIVTAGEGGQGYLRPKLVQLNRIVLLRGSYTAKSQHMIQLSIADLRLSQQKNIAGIKHISRLENILVGLESHHSDTNEYVLMDNNECVIECMMSNIFLLKSDQLITPCLKLSGVNGVMRQVIIDTIWPKLMQQHQWQPVNVRNISINDLLTSDVCFICNSVNGVQMVSALYKKSKRLKKWDFDPIINLLQEEIALLFKE